MTTRYDILPAAQRHLLPLLTPLQTLGYVLYGGTAIALRLGHRTSIDFDFFSDRAMDRRALLQTVPILVEAQTIQEEPETWTMLVDASKASPQVKVSFFSSLGFGRVGTPTQSAGGELLMASMDDLLGHKLKVLLQRIEAKDYVDIAAMINDGQTLEAGIGAAMALFPPSFPATEALRALVYFDDTGLQTLPGAVRAALITNVSGFTYPQQMALVSDRLS